MKTLLNPGDSTRPVFISLAAMLLLSLSVSTVHAQDTPVRVIRSENPRCHSDPPLIYKMAYRFAWNIQNMAIDEWKTGLKFDPDNATLLFYIGSAYKDLGQEEESNFWLEKAYQLNPCLKN